MQEVFAVLGIEKRVGEDLFKEIYKLVRDDVQAHKDSNNDGADDLPF